MVSREWIGSHRWVPDERLSLAPGFFSLSHVLLDLLLSAIE
jgi:hypothetical protein